MGSMVSEDDVALCLVRGAPSAKHPSCALSVNLTAGCFADNLQPAHLQLASHNIADYCTSLDVPRRDHLCLRTGEAVLVVTFLFYF